MLFWWRTARATTTGPERRGGVEHPGCRRRDVPLAEGEEQVGRRVSEQRRDHDVHPNGRATGQRLASHDDHHEENSGADDQSGQGHLDRGQAAERELDPQERGTPDHREQPGFGQRGAMKSFPCLTRLRCHKGALSGRRV